MPILDRHNRDAVDRYSAFVRTSPYGSATQDLNWASVKRGWLHEAVYLEDENGIYAAMSLLVKRMGPFALLYAPRGPVADASDLQTVQALLKEAAPLVKKYRAFALKFDPEIPYTEALERAYTDVGYVVRGRVQERHDLIQPRYNMILSLKGEDEAHLLSRFSSKTRYNISLARRRGVTVRHEASEEALKAFYALYEIMSARNRLVPRQYTYFQDLMKAFEGHVRIYLAEHEGDILSAALALPYGDKLWYMYGASSNEKRNVMPNHLMQWEMIDWALQMGMHRYDFGGVFHLDKEDGLYRFKEGFCREEGATELLGEVDKVYNKPIYAFFTRAYPVLQEVMIKLFRRT